MMRSVGSLRADYTKASSSRASSDGTTSDPQNGRTEMDECKELTSVSETIGEA
jgi:hypothetical protein